MLEETTNRSFTGHESINNTELIHMNGRVYDPTVGRFMSADPFIQAPYNTQSYNRYTYVMNNPINHIDPSGYIFKRIGKELERTGKRVGKEVERAGKRVWKEINRDPDIYGPVLIAGGLTLLNTPYAPIGAGMIGLGTDLVNREEQPKINIGLTITYGGSSARVPSSTETFLTSGEGVL